MANEKRLIDAEQAKRATYEEIFWTESEQAVVRNFLAKIPTVDAVPVVHGRWLYEAHRESSNYRWNVTAECSECCDEKKEIWAGFFPNVPDWLARDVAMQSAKSVKLSNYCPNCGAKMDGGNEDGC